MKRKFSDVLEAEKRKRETIGKEDLFFEENYFVFSDGPNDKNPLKIKIREIVSGVKGLFTWDCGLLLSYYIVKNKNIFAPSKNILEISAGTGIPSITCLEISKSICKRNSFAKSSKLIITDKEMESNQRNKVLENLKYNLEINNFEKTDYNVQTLNWGDFKHLAKLDIIIASDIFYEESRFKDIIASVAYLMKTNGNENTKFLFSYKIRDENASIEMELKHWELEGKSIPISGFLTFENYLETWNGNQKTIEKNNTNLKITYKNLIQSTRLFIVTNKKLQD